jgi:hypothetical protein
LGTIFDQPDQKVKVAAAAAEHVIITKLCPWPASCRRGTPINGPDRRQTQVTFPAGAPLSEVTVITPPSGNATDFGHQ